MKKLFILLALMLASLSSWAQNWEPKDREKATENYNILVHKLSDQEREQLIENQEYVKDELKQIEGIQLYTAGEWADYYAVKNIKEKLQNIKKRYDDAPVLQEPFGAWLAMQTVKTQDMPIGFLNSLFMLIAAECDNRDEARQLAMMAEEIRMNYNSVLLID